MVIGFDESIYFVAVSILRTLSDDVSLNDWVSNILFILHLFHKWRVIEIGNIVSSLFDSFNVVTIDSSFFVFVLIRDFNLCFNFYFRAIDDGFVFEIKNLFVM